MIHGNGKFVKDVRRMMYWNAGKSGLDDFVGEARGILRNHTILRFHH
jgi:hypothetical protein